MDDDDEPIRRPPSPDTAWGRIIARDRHLYADLWDCDLSTEEGQADYDINCKMMTLVLHPLGLENVHAVFSREQPEFGRPGGHGG